MPEEHFVVIGNGPAGNQAGLTLSEEAPESRITLISRNRSSCYRPHLLPQLIAGEIDEADLYVCPLNSYKSKGIRLRTGQQVVELNLLQNEVILDHKEVIPYTGLVIAVGGKPRIPEPLMIFEDLMLTLKTLEDARTWIDRLSEIDSVLMIGGDLTSLALTKALLHLNKKVYFILNEDAFWPLRCDEDLLRKVDQKLTQRGVEVIRSGRIESLSRLSENACELIVKDRKITVGIIGAFFGLVPDIKFLARTGLKLDRGILVDEYLNTGFVGVYATGDCAQIYHPEIRDYWVSIGHDNAVALGRTAALNLLGERVQAKAKAESIFNVQGVKVNSSWWTEF